MRELWESLKTGLVNTLIRGGLIALAAFFASGPAFVLVALGLNVAMDIYSGVKRSQKQERALLDQFRAEIAVDAGKHPEAVTVKDLHRAAEHTPVLRQSLAESNARILTGWMGTALSLMAVAFIGALVPIGILDGQTFFEWASKQGFSLAQYGAGITIGSSLIAGMALQAGRFLFGPGVRSLVGGDVTTIAERVDDLEQQLAQGVALAPEQVMEVAVAANPDLRRNIRRAYGADYLGMTPQEQCVVLTHYPARDKVVQLTDAVNRGHVAPTEIAYAVMGAASGVPWDPQPSGPKVRQKGYDFSRWAEELPELLTEGPGVGTAAALAESARNSARRFTQTQPRRASFVERLDAQRAAAPLMEAVR